MIAQLLFLILIIIKLTTRGFCHVGQPCNMLIRVCLARHAYCDENNICRCDPGYPVNVSLHSCRQGKRYSEKCEYTEECYYYDPNSYCSQIPYSSRCECHQGYLYNELKNSCEKVGKGNPKPANLVFPTAIGLSLAFASIICCCLVLWHVCKRRNLANVAFSRNRTSESHYLSTNRGSLRSVCIPSAPALEEALPTYDTALSLKETEDSEPPPSYEEVICQEPNFKS